MHILLYNSIQLLLFFLVEQSKVMSNKEDGMGDKACRNPVKSFAEITSCHTINISDNFPCEREEGCEKVGQPAVSPDTKCVAGRGVKRHRSEAEVANGFRQGKTENIFSSQTIIFSLLHFFLQFIVFNISKNQFQRFLKISKFFPKLERVRVAERERERHVVSV